MIVSPGPLNTSKYLFAIALFGILQVLGVPRAPADVNYDYLGIKMALPRS